MGLIEDLVAETGAGLKQALVSLGNAFIDIIPGLIAAFVIIVIGWVIGKVVKHVLVKILQSTRVDQWVEEQNLSQAIGGREISVICGSLIKWYIIIIFLTQAVGLINLDVLKTFAWGLTTYIPRVLSAIVFAIGGLLLGRYIKNAVEATQYRFRAQFALIAESVVMLITVIMGLTLVLGPGYTQILIALLNMFVYPFIVSIAMAAGVVVAIFLVLSFRTELVKVAKEVKRELK